MYVINKWDNEFHCYPPGQVLADRWYILNATKSELCQKNQRRTLKKEAIAKMKFDQNLTEQLQIKYAQMNEEHRQLFGDPGHSHQLAVEDFNKAAQALKKAYVPMTNTALYLNTANNSLGYCQEACPPKTINDLERKKETTNMCYKCATPTAAGASVNISAQSQPSDLSKARDFLAKRVEETAAKFREDLHSTFKMSAPEPKTIQDAIDWIKAGKYTTWSDEADTLKNERYRSYIGFGDYIKFKDPDYKADKEGFTAAVKKMEAAKQSAIDTIRVLSEKEGLEALKTFEAATFH